MGQSEPIKRRARSPEKKKARRQEILDVAHRILTSAGFDQFSMEVLARETGLARASLYRYFSSREEVLLALYQQLRETWKNQLCQKLRPGMTDESFVRAYYKASSLDPIQIQLRSRLESTIKHNINRAVFAEEVRMSQAVLSELIDHLRECTGLSDETCHDLIISFGALLVGASQLDSTPRMERDLLPPGARRTSKALSYQHLFESNGKRILDGLRKEAD